MIGWREWVALPDLEVGRIKVKVDTGARSSSLHAWDIQPFLRRGRRMVRFVVHPIQRDLERTICCETEMAEERWVRSSSGERELRPVILTPVRLLGKEWPIEVTLTRRDEMGFRMLLGRQAIRGRFLVNPGRSFCDTAPAKKTKNKSKRT